MFKKATAHQISFLFRQRGAVITFFILLFLVLYNYFSNIAQFHGMDVLEMYHPANMLSISWDRSGYQGDLMLVFSMLYPVLVACPAGFSLARERASGEHLVITARMGGTSYFFSKLLSVFTVTAVIFAVPFLLELGLNCIAFPTQATGNFAHLGMYEPEYVAMVKNYLFSGLFRISPYLYAVAGILFFGILSGILGAFTAAFSCLFRVKYQILVFLPAFLVLNASVYLFQLLGNAGFRMEWYHYFFLFDETPKNGWYILFLMAALAVFSVICARIGGRKDCI